jgi:hypothetical protein
MVVATACSIIAQPTIPASKFFIPGYTMTYVDGSVSGVTPGNAGANQTWNFGSVTNTGSGYANAYYNAAATPYAANFPGSNVAMADPTASSPAYTYMTVNSSLVNFDGLIVDVNGTQMAYVYSNPQQYFALPLTMGTTFTDTYAGTLSFSQPPVTLTNYRNGTITSTVDGYGTVITPTGTYSNVLRIMVRDVVRDSLVYTGVPVPSEVTETRSTSYIYIEGNGAIAVDRFRMSYDTIVESSGTTTDFQVWYLSSVTTGLSSSIKTADLKVYPNPVSTDLYFTAGEEMQGLLSIRIVDASGREVYNGEADTRTGIPVNIPVADLRQGLYMLFAEKDNLVWSGRFIKQ